MSTGSEATMPSTSRAAAATCSRKYVLPIPWIPLRATTVPSLPVLLTSCRRSSHSFMRPTNSGSGTLASGLVGRSATHARPLARALDDALPARGDDVAPTARVLIGFYDDRPTADLDQV